MRQKKLIYFLLSVFIGVIWIIPVVYLINVALKDSTELYSAGIFAIVKNPTLNNFFEAWDKIKDYVFNSIIYVLFSVPLGIILASMVAYGVIKIKSGLRSIVVTFFTLGMLIPVHITLLPNYLTMNELGLLSSQVGIIVLYTVFNIPFAFYLIYGAFMKVDFEIEEAAIIDGASPLKIYWNVFMPICKPSIIVAGLLNFISVWNELIFANTFIQDNTMMPITTGLLQFVGEFTTAYEKITAGILMSALPIVIFFIIFRKQIMSGMTEGALKG